MDISKDLAQSIVDLLNKAFNYEGDVFGILHNTATDVLGELETLIIQDKEH